jgi:hypothetical protein
MRFPFGRAEVRRTCAHHLRDGHLHTKYPTPRQITPELCSQRHHTCHVTTPTNPPASTLSQHKQGTLPCLWYVYTSTLSPFFGGQWLLRGPSGNAIDPTTQCAGDLRSFPTAEVKSESVWQTWEETSRAAWRYRLRMLVNFHSIQRLGHSRSAHSPQAYRAEGPTFQVASSPL